MPLRLAGNSNGGTRFPGCSRVLGLLSSSLAGDGFLKGHIKMMMMQQRSPYPGLSDAANGVLLLSFVQELRPCNDAVVEPLLQKEKKVVNPCEVKVYHLMFEGLGASPLGS